MADETKENKGCDEKRGINEVSLELMKFIAQTTGFGKPSTSSVGFASKASNSGAEEYTDALLTLFERCREVVKKS